MVEFAEFCSTSVVPSYNDIYDLLSPGYEIADRLILPLQPTLTKPVWTNISSPQQELEMTITELITGQLTSTISSCLELFTEILELNIEDILPDIPGFEGYNLISIIQGKFTEMASSVDEDFNFDAVTLLPNPIYPNIDVTNMYGVTTTQVAVNEYYQQLTEVLQDLANEIIEDAIDLPAYPTLDQIYQLMDNLGYSSPYSLENLLDITIPGFDYSLDMPIPLVPNQDVSQFDFVQGLKNLYNGLSNEAMKVILEFIEEDLEEDIEIPIYCIIVGVEDE